MQEEWVRWEPIKDLSGKYSVDSVIMGEKSLTIGLSSECNPTKKVEVRFEYAVDAYRYTNDSFCLKVCTDLVAKYGKEFHGNWSFFKVDHSEYFHWLSGKSCAYADEFPFTHFCIVGSDEIVDVLARYEPMVIFVE